MTAEQMLDRGGHTVIGDARRWYRYTGHPPPLQQVAGQVRTASGFTIGRPTAEGPALRALAPLWRPSEAPARRPSEVPAGLHGRLLDLLHRLEAEGTDLPSCGELAQELGIERGAARVSSALISLAKSGRVHYWHGGLQAHRGQGVLRIAGSDVELRTAGAPADVHV